MRQIITIIIIGILLIIAGQTKTSFAMRNYGSAVASTTQTIPVLTGYLGSGSTVYFHLRTAGDITTNQNIFDFPNSGVLSVYSQFKTYIENSRLYFFSCGGFFCANSSTWYTSISASTDYQIAIKYKFNTDISDTPVIFINGVKQTVTQDLASPTLAGSNGANVGNIRFLSLAGGVNPLLGWLGDFAFWNYGMTDDELRLLTSNRQYRYPLQLGTSYNGTTLLINYFQFDEADDQDVYDYMPTGNVVKANATNYYPNYFLSY